MNYDPSKPLLFQHIPKCAGTSLLNVFRFWFGDRLWTHYYDNKLNEPPKILPESELAGEGGWARCLFGHFSRGRGTGVEDYYPHVGQIITVIRDPFDHAVSSYFFAKSRASGGKPNLLGRAILERELSLESYLEEFGCYYGDFLPLDLSKANYRNLLRDRFLFIGLTERLEDTVGSLASILGKPKAVVPRKNVSKRGRRENFSALREGFEGRNRFMVDVYNECVLIFEERRKRSFWEGITDRFMPLVRSKSARSDLE